MSEKMQFVLVETISQYRMRYVVEVPVGIDDHGVDTSLWALDTVTCDEAKEFSQEWLGEMILSHRVINKKEILSMLAIDHPEWIDRTTEKKIDVFVTTWDKSE
jgi:hypothetical protein